MQEVVAVRSSVLAQRRVLQLLQLPQKGVWEVRVLEPPRLPDELGLRDDTARVRGVEAGEGVQVRPELLVKFGVQGSRGLGAAGGRFQARGCSW